MEQQYTISHKGADSCILFFNGWAMDAYVMNQLNSNGRDVFHCFNYQHVSPLNIDLSRYKRIHLVAWSLGVWMAEQVYAKHPFRYDTATALNGTGKPIHETYGIPPEVFKSTLDAWDERNRSKFWLRTWGGKTQLDAHQEHLPRRSVASQHNELEWLWEHAQKGIVGGIKWDRAWIGLSDKITPPTNQQAFWRNKANMVQKELPHYPFLGLDSWEEVLTPPKASQILS